MKRFLTIAIVMVLTVAAWLPAQVTRPEDLKFPPLSFKPPRPDQFRSVLGNGLRTYMIEDHTLPMVTVTAFINFGSLYDPAEKKGLSSLLAGTLIKGGTKKEDGAAIEEKLDFLGASLNYRDDERISSLNLTVLSKDLDEGLKIFADVLTSPEFREESITIPRNRLIERLRQANDAPSTVLSREYEKLLYGTHALTNQTFKKTLEAATRQDLKVTHSRFFTPGNVILVASGDFKKNVLQAKLGKLLQTWKTVSVRIPAFSKQFPEPEPGVYYIQKEINQGYVSMGHLGIEDTNPDYFAVQVMNFILGGGSFTSRITSKVRSDEGLAYNTGSRFTYRWGFPGIFSGYVQTKSLTVGYAIDLIRREFERIRNETVAADEMETAKNYYLESFADFFATPSSVVNTFARLEMEGKPRDYYQTYQEKISKVKAADVQRVAQKYIHPDKMVILIVGNWKECNVTSEKFPFALDKFGKIHRISLVDYLTGAEIK